MNITNNKIIITGGASGIGMGLTERFIKEGNTVIVCGRRADVLAEAKEKFPTLITKQCDLENAADRVSFYQWILEHHPDANVLVNNAGIQQWMNITDDHFFMRAQQEIAINIEAPIHLISLFAKASAIKTIMNVTSGLAFVPLTKTPVYSATKSFLHSFTLSIEKLLLQQHIEVIEIIPPALNTDLGGKGLHDTAPPVSAFIESIFEQLAAGKNKLTFGFSEVLAKATPDELQQTFNRMNP